MSDRLCCCVFSQRKKEYEIEMNRFLSVSKPSIFLFLFLPALNVTNPFF